MRDFRPILNILGLLLCIESIALLIPMIFDLMNNNQDWKQFFYISCITFLIGLVLYVGFKKENIKINLFLCIPKKQEKLILLLILTF